MKLERAVVRPFRAEDGDERKTEILRRERRWARSAEHDLDRLWHAKPNATRDHRRSEIRRPDARREEIERTARHRMAIGADNEAPRQRSTPLRHHLMADPDANVVELDAEVRRECANTMVERSRLGRRRRRVVVEREDDLRRIE